MLATGAVDVSARYVRNEGSLPRDQLTESELCYVCIYCNSTVISFPLVNTFIL